MRWTSDEDDLRVYRKLRQTMVQRELIDNGITDEGARILAEALRRNGRLEHLCVSDNSIRTDGLRALCGAMERNVTLQTLKLSLNTCVEDKSLMAVLNAALKRR